MCVEYLVAFSLFCTSTTFFIMEYIWFVVILFSLIGGNLSTNVNQCPGGKCRKLGAVLEPFQYNEFQKTLPIWKNTL